MLISLRQLLSGGPPRQEHTPLAHSTLRMQLHTLQLKCADQAKRIEALERENQELKRGPQLSLSLNRRLG